MPWVQPWAGVTAPLGLPRNAATGRQYSGINILILWCAVAERGFSGQTWLTFCPKRAIPPTAGIAAIPAVPGRRARPERTVPPGSFAELS